MTRLKIHGLIVFTIFFIAVIALSGCVPKEKKGEFHSYNDSNELIQILTEKLKNGTLKDALPPDLEKAVIERIKTGTVKDFMPPASIIVVGMMIPIISIIAFFALLIVLVRLYHLRVMARIEKGDLERKPLNIRWELLILFFGIILTFLGPAISIYTISLFDLQSWTITSGIIPFFTGIALLVFYKTYIKIKNNK